MKKHLAWIVVVLAGVVGFGGGVAFHFWIGSDRGQQPVAAVSTEGAADRAPDVVGRKRPLFGLPGPDGERRSIAAYDGDVILLNFWATWCPPCRREIPALVTLQHQLRDRDFTVVGVALDDRDSVHRFAREHGIDYPLLIGARDAFAIAGRYGNPRGTLPYSVVIDRDGTIRATHQGALTREAAEKLVRPLL